MLCAIGADRAGRRAARTASAGIASAGLIALAALAGSGSSASAQQQDSILKQAAKVAGFATDVAPPADFVAKTRPTSDLDYIPVFQPPPEPARPLLKSDQLKAMQSDLEGVSKEHNTIRQAFPPAAKALAEDQAGQKKPNSSAAGAQQ
jgi:hypothetical protein